MIEIKNLEVAAGDKKILKWVSLEFELWKNYCLLWTNGSWKSTLSSTLMWSPKYRVTGGEVIITGQTQGTAPTKSSRGKPCIHPESKNLLDLNPEQRAAEWLFLSFQNVPEILWIKLSEYLRTIYNISLKNAWTDVKELSPFIFKRFIKKYLTELSIDEKFLERDLNVWFSGWERRKIEILQMKLIWPKYIILDEIDSWLDLDAFRTVAELLKSISNKKNTLIIITHYFKILEYIEVDEVYVLKDWKIIKKGWQSLAQEISENGFENI